MLRRLYPRWLGGPQKDLSSMINRRNRLSAENHIILDGLTIRLLKSYWALSISYSRHLRVLYMGRTGSMFDGSWGGVSKFIWKTWRVGLVDFAYVMTWVKWILEQQDVMDWNGVRWLSAGSTACSSEHIDKPSGFGKAMNFLHSHLHGTFSGRTFSHIMLWETEASSFVPGARTD
jgi:hypothetical protein